ncbi:hypothetical protein OCU04_008245 [Sclerotinia nivalis]|uniref:Uncharacterized protein n=1 Tax=Sclerotinia nivalis TaxID=352851 RepID=A0A9X0AHN8_9HELO|nr:hypothetical protein OCU04_008245 [Sclerotinia nivalis]
MFKVTTEHSKFLLSLATICESQISQLPTTTKVEPKVGFLLPPIVGPMLIGRRLKPTYRVDIIALELPIVLLKDSRSIRTTTARYHAQTVKCEFAGVAGMMFRNFFNIVALTPSRKMPNWAL